MAEKSNVVIIFYYFSPWEINLRSLCGVVHSLGWKGTTQIYNIMMMMRQAMKKREGGGGGGGGG